MLFHFLRPKRSEFSTTSEEATVKALVVSGALFCILCAGCGGVEKQSTTPLPVTLSAIKVSTTSSILPLGGTQPLAVTGTYSDGSAHDLTDKVVWSSSLTSLATVNNLGVVTGVGRGSVAITATKDTLTDQVNLTVGPPALARIDLSPSSFAIPSNTMRPLSAIGTYTDGTTREVNDLITAWSSSDGARAIVSSDGVVTAVDVGTATVTAASGKVSASATVTVSTSQLVRMAVVPYQPVVGIGVMQRFVALGTFDDYSTHELASVSWQSSNPAIATIDPAGVTAPLAAGSSLMTAKCGASTGSTTLTVLPATLASIRVNPGTASIARGTGTRLLPEGILTDGSVSDLPVVEWTSDDQSIATVDNSGWAVAISPGTSKIAAKVGSITGVIQLSVTNAELQSVVLAPASPQLPVLALKKLYAFGKFSDGTVQDITDRSRWWSNSSHTATVNAHGLVSSNAYGSATLLASVGDIYGSTPLNVPSLTVESAEVRPANASLPKGAKMAYSLISTLSDGTTSVPDAPLWLTSPITMATSSTGGVVTARTAGIGKVYGETCCKTAYALLTVTNADAQSLTIDLPSSSVPMGASPQLRALATFSDGSTVDVSNAVHWSSSQPGVVLVDSQGVATTVASGSSTIAASFGPVEGGSGVVIANSVMTVTPSHLVALTLSPGFVRMILGQTQLIGAKGIFSDDTSHSLKGVEWHSSDASVAIVLPSGMVISTGRGNAVITATAGGINATIAVEVI